MTSTHPVCWRLYQSELDIINAEISKLKRLSLTSQVVGLPIALLGLISFFFPNLISNNVTIDNVSKLSSMLFGSLFFATINFFNKGDLLSLKKRRNDLEVFIDRYGAFEEKTDEERTKLWNDCEKIIEKRQGL